MVIEMPTSVQQRPVNAALSESAVIVMKSNDVLRAVVEDLELNKRAEFNPALRDKGISDRAKNWLSGIAATVRGKADQLESEMADPLRPSDPLAGTVRGLRSKVTSKVLGESFVIEVAAQSSDPRLAAMISDKIAQEYLEKQLEQNARAGGKATVWLEERVSELRADVAAAELKVAEFRTNTLNSGEQMTQDLEPRIEELNAHLARLTTEASDLKARTDEIRELFETSNYIALTEILNLAVVSELIGELSEEEARVADLKARYDDHPGVAKAIEERNLVARQLDEQIERALSGLDIRSEIIAEQRETLRAELQSARRALADSRQKELLFHELEREAEASRDVYNRFLLQLKEVREQSLLQAPEASIVSYAEVPVHPVAPQKKKMAAVAGVGGGLFVLALIVLTGGSVGRVRTPLAVSAQTGVSSVIQIPYVRGAKSPIELLNKARQPSGSDLLRAVNWLRLRISGRETNGVQVIMITSTAPGEGKSALSLLLAEAYEAGGYETLLVNADPAQGGISELEGTEEFRKSKFSFLDYSEEAVHSLESNGGLENALKKRQREMRRTDAIIVDGPVALSSPEFIEFGLLADHVIMACEWNKTGTEELKHSIDLLKAEGLNVTAVAINKVPTKEMTPVTVPLSTTRRPLSLPPPNAT
ncbi:exopolysaccharide transport family protein [Shimia sediminis]|uniref:exopolysaccharide transport family protein n=1 Tax=Shimia sediminis TaxID=2497945 RepID=UPI00197E17B2|nr:exopolysaccharide transport family protein [Shimia sediminis]